MRTIWKSKLVPGPNYLELPADANFLSAQTQDDNPNVWSVVDTDNDVRSYRVWCLATGQELPDGLDGARYLGTCVCFEGELVWHIFAG